MQARNFEYNFRLEAPNILTGLSAGILSIAAVKGKLCEVLVIDTFQIKKKRQQKTKVSDRNVERITSLPFSEIMTERPTDYTNKCRR